jgi:DNA-binding FrmR family transcriptional regulator
MVEHENCANRLKQTIHRIHRIQGQLTALERDIQIEHDCEYLLTQAIAIEKAVGSLILHLMEGQLDDQITPMLRQEPERAVRDVKRLFELVTR